MRACFEDDDLDDRAVRGEAHMGVPVLRGFACNRFVREMDHERVVLLEIRDPHL